MVLREPFQITVYENLKWCVIYMGMTALSYQVNATAPTGAIPPFTIPPFQKHRKTE